MKEERASQARRFFTPESPVQNLLYNLRCALNRLNNTFHQSSSNIIAMRGRSPAQPEIDVYGAATDKAWRCRPCIPFA